MGARKRPIITIDVETDPFLRGRDPRPFLWGMYDGERYRTFPDAASLMRYLLTLGPIIVYAHNGGKFDYTYLFEFLEPYTEILIISGRLAKFIVGEIEFRDSWSILPVALKHLGKGGIEFWKLEATVRDTHMAEIERYNRQDCVALWEAVVAFTSSYGTKLTLAGAALDYWSKKFGHDKPRSDALFYKSIQPYYSGGRVQCFHKGMIHGEFHVVDINSAYPFAMTHKHPISVAYSNYTPKKSEPIIMQSLYRIEAISKGGLPFKDEDGALTFPEDDDAREYEVTGWELQAAIDTKTLTYWKPLGRRDFLKEIEFNDYVGHFFAEKDAGKKAGDILRTQFSKLMLNSLYGKFGACPDNYSSYGLVPCSDIVTCIQDPTVRLGRNQGPWDWAGNLGEMALMQGKDPSTGENNPVDSQYYNVATAASITGFVRAYLWRHICKVRAAGGVVLYCDTDSIVYRLEGDPSKHPFALTDKLGDWSHEGLFNYGAIAGKKLYAFKHEPGYYQEKCNAAKLKGKKKPEEWKSASKGVRLTPEQVVEIAQGKEIVWEAEAPAPSVHRKVKAGEKVPAVKFMSRRVKMT
jgi:hypothetical protein